MEIYEKNTETNFPFHCIYNDCTYHFRTKNEAEYFADAMENFSKTKQMLTELHFLTEFVNPAFKQGNSVYDRSVKLINKR